MPNLRVIYDNAAQDTTVTASSTAGTMVASNLQAQSKLWRSVGTTARLSAIHPTSFPLRAVVLALSNLSPTATIRVRSTNEAVRVNLMTYSENIDNGTWVLTAASIMPNATKAPDGTWTAAKIMDTTANTAHYVGQAVPVQAANTQVTFSIFVKAAEYDMIDINLAPGQNRDTVFDLLNVNVPTKDASVTATIKFIGNGWYRCTVTATIQAVAGPVFLIPYKRSSGINFVGTGTSGIYVWGAQLELGATATSYYPSNLALTSRASTATYFGSDGLIKTATANVARMQYTPTNLTIPPKLLLEAAATNLFLYSDQFSNAAWTKGTNTLATPSGTVTSPDGALNATSFRGTIAGNNSLTQTLTLTQNQTYTLSVHFKQGAYTGQVQLADTTQAGTVVFDFATNNIASTSGIFSAPAVYDCGNNWTRVSVVVTPTVATGAHAIVLSAANGVNWIYMWGMQIETGLFASSYIPTTSASATRAADISTSVAATRPHGYIDNWQGYAYDSGNVLACPAPATDIRGMTSAQAASAYSVGGGSCAVHWLPSLTTSGGMAIDIVDTSNLQGYIEAGNLVIGDYWSPRINAGYGAAVAPKSFTKNERTESGKLRSDKGPIAKTLSLSLKNMDSTDRNKLWDIALGNDLSTPMFVSLMPFTTDTTVERTQEKIHQVYGKLTQQAKISLDSFGISQATLEIESV